MAISDIYEYYANECAVKTSVSFSKGDEETAEVTVEGRANYLKNRDSLTNGWSTFIPSGYTLVSKSFEINNGFGKFTLHCKKFDTVSFSPMRTTFRVSMVETTYELKDHPYLTASARIARIIALWLATDEAQRVTVNGNTVKYFYSDGNELTEIKDNAETSKAHKFCKAYMAGIRNFVRYYPVIEKISTLKNPQGVTRSDNSYTGGSFTFADDIGKYDSPPVSLAGYQSSKWFKSRDDYVQNGDKSWTRTEQWTFTPDAQNGINAWIYQEIS